MLGNMTNTIETWAALQTGLGLKVHFVLQPVIGWNTKPLTAVERKCHGRDIKKLPSFNEFACWNIHAYYSQSIQEVCRKNGIDYHDANTWLSAGACNEMTVFSDVCHLSDAGAEFVGKMILSELDLQDG